MKDFWYALTVLLGMVVILGGVFLFGSFVWWIVILIRDDAEQIKAGRKEAHR